MEDVKVFLEPDLKKKYRHLCFEQNTTMSADLRSYIERRVFGGLNPNLAPELLKFLLNKNRPSNPTIVKFATKLGIDTEELMIVCNLIFEEENSKNGCD